MLIHAVVTVLICTNNLPLHRAKYHWIEEMIWVSSNKIVWLYGLWPNSLPGSFNNIETSRKSLCSFNTRLLENVVSRLKTLICFQQFQQKVWWRWASYIRQWMFIEPVGISRQTRNSSSFIDVGATVYHWQWRASLHESPSLFVSLYFKTGESRVLSEHHMDL